MAGPADRPNPNGSTNDADERLPYAAANYAEYVAAINDGQPRSI
jgi:hypothetical protein